MHRFIPIFVLICTLAACKPDAFFRAEKDVPEAGWAYADTLDFAFEITDTSRRYAMSLDVAWADTFKHQNLYLKLGTLFPDGRYMQVVRSYDMFDTDGKPTGERTSGGHKANYVLQETTKFSASGTYHFTVAQETREAVLGGVKSIGLSLK